MAPSGKTHSHRLKDMNIGEALAGCGFAHIGRSDLGCRDVVLSVK